MFEELTQALRHYGALPSQLVSLTSEEPATLRYADLLRAPVEGAQPVAVELQGQPRAYVFDDRTRQATPQTLVSWIRRIAFRGDADYVGVLRPGQLDVYAAALGSETVPREIQGLPDGQLRFPTLLHAPPKGHTESVRKELRNLLLGSIAKVGEHGVKNPDDALSLVGRALFWRFLIDRKLLEGIDLNEICEGARSLEACLDRKSRALKTFEWLDETFNGGLLAFDDARPPRNFPDTVFGVLSNIARGATPQGQLRLPTDWNEVNFAHIPVGLLSEVYEAFSHDSDPEKAKKDSIFYTPRHLAEFVVDEAMDALEGVEEPRVLDPAAGAGVFLVAVFRALVAREWKRTGGPPSRAVVRRILNKQLTGFDINGPALRLAELALYLTAIELDPVRKPRPLSLLKFKPPLRDNVLFLRGGGRDQGSLGPVKAPFKEAFDLVVGNPPWRGTEKGEASEGPAPEKSDRSKEKPPPKKQWVSDTRALVAARLKDDARAESFDFPDTNPDLPFVYRAMEWAKPEGQIALVTHARWLFLQSKPARDARRNLLECVQATGILNGASLRRPSVWPNIEAPFCLLFARNVRSQPEDAFHFVTPRHLPEAPGRPNQLRIDWADATDVPVSAAIAEPWLLKLRFRGTTFDAGVLRRLVAQFPALSKYLEGDLKTCLENGYIKGGRAKDATGMGDLKDLGTEKARGRSQRDEPVRTHPFRLNISSLEPFREKKLHRPRERAIYVAPLLLVRQSPPKDPSSPRSVIAEQDVAFSQSWHGASFADVPQGLDVARYLQVLLQSKLFLWFQVLTDGGFGVERERYVKENLEAFPVVPYAKLSAKQRREAASLSEALWQDGWTAGLATRIDDFVFEVFGLDDVDGDTVRDTFDTALTYSRDRQNAMKPPTREQTDSFVAVLSEELNIIWESKGAEARVRRRAEVSAGPWEVLQVDRTLPGARGPADVALPWVQFLKQADEAGASLVVVRVSGKTTLIGMLRQYRLWTRTRARMLVTTLLSGADR